MRAFFRTIPVLFPKGHVRRVVNRHTASYVRALFFFVLVICAGILLQILVFLDQKVVDTKSAYEANLKQFRYWSSVASQFPNIPDILYNASVSALNVGKTPEAMRYIEKAIKIDPLFKEAQKLKQSISKG